MYLFSLKIGISYLRIGNCLTGRKIFTFFMLLQHNWRKRLFSTKFSQLQLPFAYFDTLLSLPFSIIIVLMSFSLGRMLWMSTKVLSFKDTLIFGLGEVNKPKFWLECVEKFMDLIGLGIFGAIKRFEELENSYLDLNWLFNDFWICEIIIKYFILRLYV